MEYQDKSQFLFETETSAKHVFKDCTDPVRAQACFDYFEQMERDEALKLKAQREAEE